MEPGPAWALRADLCPLAWRLGLASEASCRAWKDDIAEQVSTSGSLLVSGQWPATQVCVPSTTITSLETPSPWTQAPRPSRGHGLAVDQHLSHPRELPSTDKTPFPRGSVLPLGLTQLQVHQCHRLTLPPRHQPAPQTPLGHLSVTSMPLGSHLQPASQLLQGSASL